MSKESNIELKQQVKQFQVIGSKSHTSLIMQLMSGYRDPDESNQDNYSLEDYKTIAFSIYSRIPPWDVKKDIKDENGIVIGTEVKSENFFTQMRNAYDAIQDSNDKAIFMHNAKILISELISANPSTEYLDATNQGLQDFYQYAKVSDDKVHYSFESAKADLMAKVDITKSTNKKIQAEINSQPEAGKQSFSETLSSKPNKQTTKDIAQDIKEIQLGLLRQLDLSDMHNQKWSKDKDQELSYSSITKFFNDFSTMVTNDIVSAKTEEEQQKIYSLYLDIATEAVKLNDFNTAVAIKAGLQSAPIGRLKHLSTSKKNQSRLEKLNKLFSNDGNKKNLRTAYNTARESGETFVPYLGTFSGDLTFIGDGNPDKVRDKDNGVKFLQEGVVIRYIADAKSKAQQAERKPYVFDLCNRISEPSKLTESEQYKKSLIFRPRNPINLSEIKSLNDLARSFKEGSIHTMLSVTLEKGGKEYTGKKAFHHVVETILPLYSNPNLSDKLDGSTANSVLDSIEQWAMNHDQTSQELTEQISVARAKITQTPDDKKQLSQLHAYQENLVDIYINASLDDRKAIRKDTNGFKDSADDYIKGEVDKIIISFNSVDRVEKLKKDNEALMSVISEDVMPSNIHVSLTTLLELEALKKEATSQKSSQIEYVSNIATQIHTDITNHDSPFMKYRTSLVTNIAKDLDNLPIVYKDLLTDSLKYSGNKKSNDTNLKNIRDALSILMNEPTMKDQASAAKQVIDNKLLKLDKCQAEKYNTLPVENQLKLARDIILLVDDDDPLVQGWAKELYENPKIKEQVLLAEKHDLHSAQSIQDEIASQLLKHLAKLSTKEKNYDAKAAEEDIKESYQKSLNKLEALEAGPFEKVASAASDAKDNINNLYQSYIAEVEKYRLGKHKATKVQVPKPKSLSKDKNEGNIQDTSISNLSESEKALCQKYNLSEEEIKILKIYGMNTEMHIKDWQNEFSEVQSKQEFESAFLHIGERLTWNYPGSEKTTARMKLAVLIAADLNEPDISNLDMSEIESKCIANLIHDEPRYRDSRKEALYLSQKAAEIDNYQGSFKSVMLKLSGKSEVFYSTADIKKFKAKFIKEDRPTELNADTAIQEHVKDFFSGMAPIEKEIKIAIGMIEHGKICLSKFEGTLFREDGTLTDEFISHVKSDSNIPSSYTDLNSYDSMLFRHMMTYINSQANLTQQEVNQQSNSREMEILFSVEDQAMLKSELNSKSNIPDTREDQAKILADNLNFTGKTKNEYLNFVTSEKSYASDLASVIENRSKFEQAYDNLSPKELNGYSSKADFQNLSGKLKQLHEQHQILSASLQKAPPAIDEIKALMPELNKAYAEFIILSSKFKAPPQVNYAAQTSISDTAFSNDLTSILIQPVQRFPKYEVIFKDICQYAQNQEENDQEPSPLYIHEFQEFLNAVKNFNRVLNNKIGTHADKELLDNHIKDLAKNMPNNPADPEAIFLKALIQHLKISQTLTDSKKINVQFVTSQARKACTKENISPIVAAQLDAKYTKQLNHWRHPGLFDPRKLAMDLPSISEHERELIMSVLSDREKESLDIFVKFSQQTTKVEPLRTETKDEEVNTVASKDNQEHKHSTTSKKQQVNIREAQELVQKLIYNTNNITKDEFNKLNDNLSTNERLILEKHLKHVEKQLNLNEFQDDQNDGLQNIQATVLRDNEQESNEKKQDVITEEDDLPEVWSPTISLDDDTKLSNSIILSNLNSEIERLNNTDGDNKSQLDTLYSLRTICESRSHFGKINFDDIVGAIKVGISDTQRTQLDENLKALQISKLFQPKESVNLQQPIVTGINKPSSEKNNIESSNKQKENEQIKLFKLQELAFQLASDPKKEISEDELKFLSENLTDLEKEHPQWKNLLDTRDSPSTNKPLTQSTTTAVEQENLEQQTSKWKPAEVASKKRAATFLNQSLQTTAKKPKTTHEAPQETTQNKQASLMGKQPPVSTQHVMQQLKQAQKTVTGTADNLSIQSIADAANKQQISDGENSQIADIKTFPNKGTTKNGIMIAFKTDKPNTVVKTYAEDMGNDKVQFSIQKNAAEEHKKTGIQEMCRIAVAAADENTVFNVPTSTKNPERQEFIEQCFKEAIQEAVKQNRFPNGAPTININATPPKPRGPKGPGAASAA